MNDNQGVSEGKVDYSGRLKKIKEKAKNSNKKKTGSSSFEKIIRKMNSANDRYSKYKADRKRAKTARRRQQRRDLFLLDAKTTSEYEQLTASLISDTKIVLDEKLKEIMSYYDKETNPIGESAVEAILFALLTEAINQRLSLKEKFINNIEDGLAHRRFMLMYDEVIEQQALVASKMQLLESKLEEKDSEDEHYDILKEKVRKREKK